MGNESVAVFSRRSELVDQLRESCPNFDFDGDGARIAVIDGDALSDTEVGARQFLSRILLVDGDELRPPDAVKQRPGDLSFARSYFLDHTAQLLAIASELAASRVIAEGLSCELELLHEMQQLMRLGDAAVVAEKIVRHVLEVAGGRQGKLLLHDPKVERYVVSFSTEHEEESIEFLPGVSAEGLQKALSSPDRFSISSIEGNHQQLIIPLQVEEDMIGVLIASLSAEESVDLEAGQKAVLYVSRVSAALGNLYQLTRSRDLAMRDDLTKAFNRRFFESYLDEESERSRRYGTIFSIIFLDLDDLKRINNRHGHLTGSRMLQEVARKILGAVRGIDKVVRFGGDEFCIILPQTDQHKAYAVAERVRRAIVEEPFRLEHDLSIPITASFGIATYPLHAGTKEELITAADTAMYRVKSTTKNAIEIATAPDTMVGGKRMTH